MPSPTGSFARAAVGLAIGMMLAACGGGGGDSRPDAPTSDGEALSVTGTDALTFEPTQATVAAGEVTVELTSQPSAPHTFTIEELGDREVARAEAGETAAGTVELEPGVYTFYCSIPGHRSAGMEGRLTVQ